VGFDLTELARLVQTDPQSAIARHAAECQAIWVLDRFPKPSIALLDGRLSGAAIGLVRRGTHQVAGNKFSLDLPETAIGLVPGGGAATWLRPLDYCFGRYLALTGHSLSSAEAHSLGLVSHIVPTALFPNVIKRLAAADPVDQVLDSLAIPPLAPALDRRLQMIERSFLGESVPDVARRLRDESGEGLEWAEATVRMIAARAPIAQALAHRLLIPGPPQSLREALVMDHRIAARRLLSKEFRDLAVLAHATSGEPSSAGTDIQLADEDAIARHFSPLEQGELVLPDYPGPPTAA
jgi:enoyl-CoA hydratase